MISPGKATALILQTAVDRVRGVSPTLGKVSARESAGGRLAGRWWQCPGVSVWNGLTAEWHPTQTLCDMLHARVLQNT